MKRLLAVFHAFIIALLIPSLAFPANFYWKATYADLAAITGLVNGDRGIVMDSSGNVTFYYRTGGAWVGASTNGVIDVRTYDSGGAVTVAGIQAAIDAANTAGYGDVFIPPGRHNVGSAITLKSNVNLRGVPGHTWLVINSATAFNIFNSSSGTLDNVVIDGIGFDGSLNYPASSQVYQFGGTFPLNNGINISRTIDNTITTSDVNNVTIKNCSFYKMSANGIIIRPHNGKSITIEGNYFNYGAYRGSPIYVAPPTAALASQYTAHVSIHGNTIDTSGPQIWYDASKEDYCGSSDGIVIDRVLDSTITNNRVHSVASIGIRIEESSRIAVNGNVVTSPGGEGIEAYKQSYDVMIVGNTVKHWGRTPNAYGIRNYGGTYVVAREFPHSVSAILPADPTGSTWFDTWPYSIDNISVGTIVAYDNTDYYVSSSDGILPFRGYSGISVTHESERCVVVGNTTIPSAAVDGSGLLTHASDYGFSFVHSVNSPTGANTGRDCKIGPNDFNGNTYPIYHPGYLDPINTRELLGTASYSGRSIDNSVIKSNRPVFSVKPTSAQTNIATGGVTVVWGTEITDQGGNFASNTFTAPVGGHYQLNLLLDVRQIDNAANLYEISIVTSNRVYLYDFDPSVLTGDQTYRTIAMSVLADMDKGDTAYVSFNQSLGSAQSDIETESKFSGFLIE